MLEIIFKNTKVNRFPKIKIYIDEDLLEEIHFEHAVEYINIPIAQDNGPHQLRIENFGKTSNDTDFAEGKIIQDTTFTIEKLKIDGFEIPDDMLLKCVFYPNWSNLDKPSNFPDLLPQCRTIGPNGEWTFDFELPVEDWLITNLHMKHKKIKSSYAVETSQMDYELSPHSLLFHKLKDEDTEQIKRIKKLIHD